MFDEPTKQEDRIVGRGETYGRAVDFIPMAIAGVIIAHQCLRQARADDLAVQIVEIPLVLHEQRASLPFERKIIAGHVHADEVYPMEKVNVIEIYQKGISRWSLVTSESGIA